MIALDAVEFRYPEGEPVLRGLGFSLVAGERLVVLGANGSGKSSLLKLIGGLEFASGGDIRFEGRSLTPAAMRDRAWRRHFRQRVGMVFQQPEAMLFNATVREEISYGPARLGMPRPDAVAAEWAGRLGLARLLDTPPFRLSGGEKQRLALACILACDPAVLLLDEPTANLDPRATGWLIDYLGRRAELTVITTTQNLSLAAELGTRALVLSEDGALLEDAPVDRVIGDTELLWRANLAHVHRHRHGDGTEHRHRHVHGDWS